MISFIANIARMRPELNRDKTWLNLEGSEGYTTSKDSCGILLTIRPCRSLNIKMASMSRLLYWPELENQTPTEGKSRQALSYVPDPGMSHHIGRPLLSGIGALGEELRTIGREGGAVDEARAVRGQEDNTAGDLLGFPQTAGGDL